jgi:hypothetical protein
LFPVNYTFAFTLRSAAITDAPSMFAYRQE